MGDLVFHVSPILSDTYNLSAPSSMGLPEHQGNGPCGDVQFRSTLYIMSVYRTLYLLLSVVREASLMMTAQATNL